MSRTGRERRAINLRDGPGNFHMQPNGVFAVAADGRVSIAPERGIAGKRRGRAGRPSPARCCVIDGKLHPAIQANGPSLHIRNGVGVAGSGTAWFAISEEPVSFGRFARLSATSSAAATPSISTAPSRASGIRAPAEDALFPLGPMVAVFRP